MVTYQPTNSWREKGGMGANDVGAHDLAAASAAPPQPSTENAGASSAGVAPATLEDAGLVLPQRVSIMLEAAMAGVRAPDGRTDGAESPYTNLGVIVGQIEAVRRRRDDRHVTTRSAQGDQQFAYYLTVNDVAADEQSVYATRYRFPIGMSSQLHTRYSDLLQDGQRVILIGPVLFERTYDPALRQSRDPLDPGMPVWHIRIEVLTIEEAPEHLADFGKVVFEGEVAREPRYTRRLSGPGGAMDIYAEVLLRDRRIMKSVSGVPRPVVTTLPVEVLVTPELEIIAGSDAMLVVGSRVRIAGHLGMRLIRRNPRRNPVVSNVLERVATEMRQRNADASARLAAYRAEMADVPRGQRSGYSGPQPVDPATLERRIGFAQRNVVEQELVQIEVGQVTVLTQRTSIDAAQRAHLITTGLERSRRRGTNGSTPEPRRATETERQVALDTATAAMLAADGHTTGSAADAAPDPTVPTRPRRRVATSTTTEPAPDAPADDRNAPEAVTPEVGRPNPTGMDDGVGDG